MKITIDWGTGRTVIEVPGNADVAFEDSGDVPRTARVASVEPTYVPPFEDELIPLPEGAIPIPQTIPQPTAFRAPSLVAQVAQCPVHLRPWKLVPAGVSKSSGKPYGAFVACEVRGCTQRPAA